MVPDTFRLIYDVTLTRGTDLTARFVINLRRAIIGRLTIRMQRKEVNSFQSYGDYWAMRDLYLTATQRNAVDCLLRGYDGQAVPGNLTLLRSGSSSGATGGPNAAFSLAF